MLWMLLWGRGCTATGAQPANPRTTHMLPPEPLLEWQEGVSRLLEWRKGRGLQGSWSDRKGCPTYQMWRKGQGLQGSWRGKKGCPTY